MPARRRAALGVAGLVVVAVIGTVVVAWFQGYRVYVVHTGSMVPALRPGSVVVDRPAPAAVHPGEIITFRVTSGPDGVVTHRVASVHGDTIRTKGDANPTVDPWKLHPSQVVGTAALRVPGAGYLFVYLRQPTGAASIVVALFMVGLLWQICFPTKRLTEVVRDEEGGPPGPSRPRAPWPVPEIVRSALATGRTRPWPVPEIVRSALATGRTRPWPVPEIVKTALFAGRAKPRPVPEAPSAFSPGARVGEGAARRIRT